MRLIFCITAVFLLKTFGAFAQPDNLGYEAPAGWTYVRNLDGLDLNGNAPQLHVAGDTVVLSADFSSNPPLKSPRKTMLIVSPDGGRSWDTLRFPDTLQNRSGSGFGLNRFIEFYSFLPHSASLCAVETSFQDSTRTFVITRDLGKTYEKYPFEPKVAKSLENFEIRAILFNPLDENDIFIRFFYGGLVSSDAILRSRDGGRTWSFPPLPQPKDGLGEEYKLTFDVRQKGLWYVQTFATYHGFITSNYQTSNNGQTFKEIKNFGQFAGIEEASLLRDVWQVYSQKNQFATIGVKDKSVNDTNTTTYNWLNIIHPNQNPSNWDSSYLNEITHYKFISDDPYKAFISSVEVRWNPLDTNVYYGNFEIFQTYDDGKSWSRVWQSNTVGIENLQIDEKNSTLWTLSRHFDKKTSKSKLALWVRKVVLTADKASPAAVTNLLIYPIPTNLIIKVSYNLLHSAATEIYLYDNLGTKIRTIYSGIQEAGEQKLIWNIPAEIPSGTYFLKLESGGSTLSQKLVITR